MNDPAVLPASPFASTQPVSGVVRAAQVLREVAGFDRGVDPRRGAVTAAQAGLLEVCAARWGDLPAEVAVQVGAVAAAVDHATRRRLDHG